MHAQTYVVCTTMRGMKSLDGGTARAVPSYSDVGKWKVSEQLLPVVLMRTKLFLGPPELLAAHLCSSRSAPR